MPEIVLNTLHVFNFHCSGLRLTEAEATQLAYDSFNTDMFSNVSLFFILTFTCFIDT